MPDTAPSDVPGETGHRGLGAALLILVLGPLATFWLAEHFRSSSERESRREFDVVCNEIRGKILDRMQAHEQVLRGGVAFFGRSGGVTREEWRRYVELQGLERHLPGIQGVGFAVLIPRTSLDEHLRTLRAQGFPDYRVRPEGDRDPYSSIVYLEPFNRRNRRAFGYDMFSEPVRRAAMERARDENAAALSGRVKLVQETDEDVQAGTLLYLPVYRRDLPVETVEQRRAALLGWVYSPYRMNDLMGGILGDWERARTERLRLEVFDGDGPAAADLLYDSRDDEEDAAAAGNGGGLEARRPIVSAGRRWLLRFTRTGERFSLWNDSRARIVLPAGLLTSLLLAGLYHSLVNTRAKALRLAGSLTAELQTAHDDLERRVAERTRELQGAKESREAILESISDAFFATNYRLEVSYFNHAAERVLGRSRAQVLGRLLFDAFPEARGSRFETHFREAVATRRFMNFEVRLDVAPLENWYDVRVYPSCEGVSVFLQVTTERKRAETQRELFEAQARQLQKSESLGRMAGAVAHHFNNQLHAMLIGLDLARSEAASLPGAVEGIDAVIESAHKAAEVSSLMLTYLGQSHARRVPLDLCEACRRSVAALRESLPAGFTLETDLPDPGPAVAASAEQLHLVLRNLLTNAAEAMVGDRGGARVRVCLVDAGALPLHARFPVEWQPREPTYACIEVADSGAGIPGEDLDKVFDPFFTRKFTGRGLGLSVVLGIVRAHDGAVALESTPGKGSRFGIYLPLSSQPVPRPSDPAPEVKGTGRNTLLLVEDEASVRTLVVASLRRAGVSVLSAADGVEALEVYRANASHIGCVLCDLTMPRMSGWETLAALRAFDPGLPVILSSGYNEAQAMAGHESERPQAFLSKPYEVRLLLQVVGKHIPVAGRS